MKYTISDGLKDEHNEYIGISIVVFEIVYRIWLSDYEVHYQ